MALDHSLGPGTVLSYFSAAQASRKYARECIAAHFVVFKLTLTHGDLCAILLNRLHIFVSRALPLRPSTSQARAKLRVKPSHE